MASPDRACGRAGAGLRESLEAWAAFGDAVPDHERGDDADWEPAWRLGRELATEVERETALGAAVWIDCPDVP